MQIPISFSGTYKITNTEKNDTEAIYDAAYTVSKEHGIEPLYNFYPQPDGRTKTVCTIVADDSLNYSIDEILKSKGINFTRKDRRELFSREDIKSRIKFPQNFPYNRDNYELIEINTDLFNQFYKIRGFAYIGDDTDVERPSRYKGVEEYIKTDSDIDASMVSIRDDGYYPQICFIDGRHRYAYYRNIGMEKIPMILDKDSIKTAKKYGII